ncbi:MAG TPA: translation initiation factor IF-2 [Candidatus Acidoferrales bacterium]|nr:translation initiation factor IF-2 [Candidatus Acidoferrales bacterium]
MTDSNQIRINELARELEVKAKAIIDYLPEAGVTEKKTHSSSIEVAAAVKVREHFRALANAEVEAEQKEVADKAAREAAARAARTKPAAPVAVAPPPPPSPPVVAAPPPAPVVPEPVQAAPPPPPATVVEAKPVVAPPPPPPPVSKPVAVVPPAEAPRVAPASTPAAARPPARPPVPPARPNVGQTQQAPNPRNQPIHSGQRHATSSAPGVPRPTVSARPPAAAPSKPTPPKPNWNPLPPGARVNPPAPPRPAAPPRPGQQNRFPARPGQTRPGQPIPGRPGQPGQHDRSGPPRPGARPGTLLPPDKAPPKAEPGKPIYERKPAARARPTMEKRFEEGERKLHPVRARTGPGEQRRSAQIERAPAPPPREPRQITITEGVTVRDLAEKLDVRAKDVLKILLDRGIFASINQALDTPMATSLAEAFNGIVNVITFEEDVVREVALEEKPENLVPRPPVVTVMGHVDHGKTSLLDAIRETEVAAGEAGGITQHIGASVVHINGRKVVFIDTPGHEAFTRMRARGAKVTDIVVLVVAADDGVMPQTQEAIDHAKAAGVPIVVAINKIDKPGAQAERVKRQLSERGLMPEEWGGDTVMVEVSAKMKQNLDKLLEMLLLVADLRELKANPKSPGAGTVLESRVDRGRGPVATVLVQTGTLNAGDVFICGAVYGKVRAMFDDHGRPSKSAGPSTPVEVLGLQGAPEAGDQFQVADEARARHIVEFRQGKLREASLARSAGARITLDQLHEQLRVGEVKELPLIIKADVQGSVEVLSEMLPKLSDDRVKLKIIHASIGAVTENDVLLASASGAIVVAFNVRPDRKASDLAQREGVEIRPHSIIYEVSDEIRKAMTGLLEPVFKETHLGRAEVRDTFRVKGVGMIAGCYVVDGILKKDSDVRVLRDGAVVYTGKITSLRRFKDDVNEVRTGFECGATVSNFADIKVADVLECFHMQKILLSEATA